jgi:hypothetical protein
MANGHLPRNIVWVAYRHQLRPGLRYSLETMTNKIEPAATLLDEVDNKTLNVLGILPNITKRLHKIHTTFGGFGLFDLATEQLISRVNMFFQHYHVSTNLSKKLDASLGYLQLQVSMPQNPFSQDYFRRGKLAPLSWVKMLWKSLHYFGITLHMLFLTIAPPRERDQVIMEIIFSRNFDFTEITRINRCIVYLQTLFLLYIMTADGKYLEHFVFDPGSNTRHSRYTFLREKPTRQDWVLWVNFWHGFTTTGGKLKTPLGGWTNPTNRIWNWYYNKERDGLYHINGTTIKYFKCKLGCQCTPSTTTYQKTHKETPVQYFPTGVPTPVVETSECRVNKLQDGPLHTTPRDNMQSFWEFLATWGETWMWDDIDFGAHSKDNLLWIAEGMTKRLLIWMTDGSYDRKKAVDISEAGWIIFCKNTGGRTTGAFSERSSTASSFQAEMLGLCALHLLACALSEYYNLNNWSATMCCNNKRALILSSHHRGQIRPNAKCANIQRSFHATKQTYQGGFKYTHVCGHMDHHLSWLQLSLTQQLNCVCNTLAKRAVTNAIRKGYHDSLTQILPREDVALIVWGDKIRGNISSSLSSHARKSVARKYHIHQQKKGKWTTEQFEEVDWEHMDHALKSKPNNYKVWQSKQTSGLCGTQVQVGLCHRPWHYGRKHSLLNVTIC